MAFVMTDGSYANEARIHTLDTRPTAPLVSIVTVTFNAAATLEDTIKSVIGAKTDRVEFLIIDGNSSDGTQDIIKKYSSNIDYWVSEPDAGIYDAMNKGIESARGEYLFFLGGDDLLVHIPEEDLGTSDILLCSVNCGGWYFEHLRSPSKLKLQMRFRNAIHPQGAFYRRSKIRFNSSFRYCADYLFNIEHINSQCSISYSSETSAIFSVYGASSGVKPKIDIVRISFEKYGFCSGIMSAMYCICSEIAGRIKQC